MQEANKDMVLETKGEGMVGGIVRDEARGRQEPGHAKAF